MSQTAANKTSVNSMVDHFVSSNRSLILKAKAALEASDFATFDQICNQISEMGITKLIASTISTAQKHREEFIARVRSTGEGGKVLIAVITLAIGAGLTFAASKILIAIGFALILIGFVVIATAVVKRAIEGINRLQEAIEARIKSIFSTS